MELGLVKEYGVIAIGAITGLGGLVVGYRARKLSNRKTEIGILKAMVQTLDARLQERDATIDAMRIKMNDIFNQNIDLMNKLGKIERDYRALQKSYNELTKNAK